MKKLLLTSIIMFSLLVLAGCAWKTKIVTDDQVVATGMVEQDSDKAVDVTQDAEVKADNHNDSSTFAIQSCDRYLKFLQCVMEKMPFGGNLYKEQINTLKKERKTEVDKKTLQESCDGLIKIMEEGQESFKEIGCEL